MGDVAEKVTNAEKTRPVRLAVQLLRDVELERRRVGRTLSGQVEHWVRLGRAFEAMPGLTVAQQRRALDVNLAPEDLTDNVRVIAVLRGEGSILELEPAERVLFNDVLSMLDATPALERGFAELRAENARDPGSR